jgi:dynein assembly factor 6, axonemal
MAFGDGNSIHLLKNLFDQCQKEGNESDSDDDGDFPNHTASLGPASIKPKKSEIKSTLENPLLQQLEPDRGVTSLEEFEQLQARDEELLDARKSPYYSIAFKQAVTTEDMFLQMGLKTPATSSCEDMVIDIELPDESVGIDQMELLVEKDSVKLVTPVYRLALSLPHKVEPKKGRAAYDPDKKLLKLTLRLNRELDFVNF